MILDPFLSMKALKNKESVQDETAKFHIQNIRP